MEYELSTIKDIFDKIPRDRIDDCMHELARMLTLAKDTGAFSESLFDDLGIKVTATDFPEKIVWKDDGKKEIQTGVRVNGKPMFYTQVKLK